MTADGPPGKTMARQASTGLKWRRVLSGGLVVVGSLTTALATFAAPGAAKGAKGTKLQSRTQANLERCETREEWAGDSIEFQIWNSGTQEKPAGRFKMSKSSPVVATAATGAG